MSGKIKILVEVEPAEDGEFLRDADDIKADLETLFEQLQMGGESVGYGVTVTVVENGL